MARCLPQRELGVAAILRGGRSRVPLLQARSCLLPSLQLYQCLGQNLVPFPQEVHVTIDSSLQRNHTMGFFIKPFLAPRTGALTPLTVVVD